MNSIVFIAFCALFFTGATSIDCDKGYFSTTGYSVPMCYQCPEYYSECALLFVQSTKINDSRIVGYKYESNGDLIAYCPPATANFDSYYNKQENLCQVNCKEGCKECRYDYDYCINCHVGYVFNKNDHTCTPVTIGLLGASLALLAISLVFGLIGCIFVIRAKKN